MILNECCIFCRYDVREKLLTDAKRSSVLGERLYFQTMSDPAHLSIQDLQAKDEGIYRCRVDFKNTPTRNLKINLTIIGESLVVLSSVICNVISLLSFDGRQWPLPLLISFSRHGVGHHKNWYDNDTSALSSCSCNTLTGTWQFFMNHFIKKGLLRRPSVRHW